MQSLQGKATLGLSVEATLPGKHPSPAQPQRMHTEAQVFPSQLAVVHPHIGLLFFTPLVGCSPDRVQNLEVHHRALYNEDQGAEEPSE
jgi:hypothetical protein